ncbi:MAG: hypothetical protein LLG04_15015 [Parachlamydia sp.]|nr:hypothetical protein [Parachlamydia sp.]
MNKVKLLATRVEREFAREGGNQIAQALRTAANKVMRQAPPPAAAGIPPNTLTTLTSDQRLGKAEKAIHSPEKPLQPAAKETQQVVLPPDDERFESVVLLNQWLEKVNHGEKTLKEAGLSETALKEMIAKIKGMEPMPLCLPLYGQMLIKNLLSLAAHVDQEYGNKTLVVDLLALATGGNPEEIATIYESLPKPPRGITRLYHFYVDLTDDQLAKLVNACPDMSELVIKSKLLTQAGIQHIERLTQLRKLVITGSSLPSPTFTSLDLSKCPQLQFLEINWCEDCTSLNLENCHNLTEVSLSFTGLKTLKFSEASKLKTVNLFCNQLQEVQLPEQANALEFFAITAPTQQKVQLSDKSFAAVGPTTRIDMPLIAPKLCGFRCRGTRIAQLTFPINAPLIRHVDVRDNRFLTKIDWPSKDRQRREPCLDALEKFDGSLTALSDLSALTKAHNLTILQMNGCTNVPTLDLTQCAKLEAAEFIDCPNLAGVTLPPDAPKLRMVKIVLSPKLTTETVTPFERYKTQIQFEKHDLDEMRAK